MTKAVAAKRGRPDAFATSESKYKALIAVRDSIVSEFPSRYLLKRLTEMGMVDATETVANGRRGRPAIVFKLTGKANSYLKLIERNRQKADEQAAVEAGAEATIG